MSCHGRRQLWVLVGAALLSACEAPGPAEARNSVGTQRPVVLAEVEAGQWQAYRRSLKEALAETGSVDIGISATPDPGAQPFLVFMARVSLPDGRSSPVAPIFLALPEGEPVGERIHIQGSQESELAADIELGLVFGSRAGATAFRVGQISPEVADEAVLFELASRPAIADSFAQGRGGAAGSYLRLVDDGGYTRTLRAGLMQVEESVLAALPDNASLLHQTMLSAADRVAEPVVVSATLLGSPQTGLADWDYELAIPPYLLADQGQFLALAGVPPPVTLSALGLAPLAFFVLAHGVGGDLSLQLRYRYSGQEHSAAAEPVTIADGGLVLTWGYLPRRALEVFGWNISESLPGLPSR